MSDFEKFKEDLIKQNNENFDQDMVDKYGSEAIDQSNEVLANMSEEDFLRQEALQDQISEQLAIAAEIGDPGSPEAQKLVDLHRQWLEVWWPEGTYTPEAHLAVGRMYYEDPNLNKYYDHVVPRGAEFLASAIQVFLG